jgi:hypothetical protein
MLVKYATGGEAALTPAVRAHVRTVTVHLKIGDTRLALSRPIAEPGASPADVVDVVDPSSGALELRLPIRPNGYPQTISEHLLTVLGLPHERPQARRRSQATAALDLYFQDLMAYLYIEAANIDRAIVGADAGPRDAARRAFFELAVGLTDAETRNLRRQEVSLKATIDRYRAETKTISDFLDRTTLPAEDDIARELNQLHEQIRQTTAALDALHSETHAEDGSLITALAEVDQAAAEEQRLRQHADQYQHAAYARRAVVAQLEIDLTRAEQAEQASHVIEHLAFRSCPRCFQVLAHDRADGLHCPVCLQPEPVPPQLEESDEEHPHQIAAQLAEAQTLLAETVEVVDHTAEEARAARLRLHALRQHVQSLTREHAAPLLATAGELSARRAAAQARVDRLREIAATRKRLGEDLQRIHEHQQRRQQVSNTIRHRMDAAGQARDRIDACERAFLREIDLLGIPGVETAQIDRTDYLPRVNGARFGEIQASGGGVTTAIHVAYSLALLTTALDDNNVNLPSLLILDSPRKAIGESESDIALGHRIYRRLVNVADSYQHRLQLVVADNSLPPAMTPGELASINVIPLGYGHDAMIPGIWHPGR